MSSPAQKDISIGLELVKKGDLKGALTYFDKASLWYEAGKVAQRLEKPKKAIEYFLKAQRPIDVANVHLSLGEYLKAAEYFAEAKAFNEAVLALEQALAKSHELTRTNAASKTLSREAKALIKQICEFAQRGTIWEVAGLWSYVLGDKIKAADYYLRSKTPQRAALIYEEHQKHLEAARAWIAAKEYSRAAEAYKRAESYQEAGDAFAQANAYDAAITCYRRCKRLELAGKVAQSIGKLDQAADLYVEGKHFYEAMLCYRKLEVTDKLIEVGVRMPKRDSNYNKASLLVIDACIRQGSITYEVDNFIGEFLLQPFTPKIQPMLFDLAKLYEAADFYESAQQIYERLAKNDPSNKALLQRLEFVRAQITGTPLAVKKVLDEDFGYKSTSERLAGYQQAPSSGTHGQSLPATAAPSQAQEKVDPTPGAILFGRYRVVRPVDQSGGSQRLRVVDQEIDDELDLKILNVQEVQANALDSFKKAIKQARKANCPSLLAIYDYGKRGDHHYVTMEALPDGNLKEHLVSQGRLQLVPGTALLIDVAEALDTLHQQEIIHHDIFPENIHLSTEGKAKIREFALPTQRDLSQLSPSPEEEAWLLKRAAYMAPEQLTGKAVAKTADIYSLGVVMYEAFTEQLPFDGKELKGLIYQQIHDQPTPPSTINPGIPAHLEQCILRCIAKDPADRYQNCGDIIDVLREVGGHQVATSAIARPKVINERYEIKSEIGRGGMGVVYRAFDRSLQRDVALKFLPHELSNRPDDLNLFLNEARSAARLSHNNIVTIHNIEICDKEHFIVMEFIDGVDIHNLLETMEKLPFKSIDLICRQVCDGLEYAHKRKVFHRDIKCANILWTNDKVVKITDFGLAKIVEGAMAQSTRVQGSPAYMSPEQILGKNVDHRTDIYSLGVALYEMITGTVPFSKGDISYHQLHSEARPIEELRSDIPQHLRDIVVKCLKKNPDERFSSAAQIAELIPK